MAFGTLTSELIFALDEAIEAIPVRKRVERFIQEGFRDIDAAEEPKAIQQTLSLEYLGRMPVVI